MKAERVVSWRITEAEMAALKEVAAEEHITMTEVIRRRVFGYRVQYDVPLDLPPQVNRKPVLRAHNAPLRLHEGGSA